MIEWENEGHLHLMTLIDLMDGGKVLVETVKRPRQWASTSVIEVKSVLDKESCSVVRGKKLREFAAATVDVAVNTHERVAGNIRTCGRV